MKKILLSIVLTIFVLNAYGQNLKRKGGLGVSLQNNIPDSIKKALAYESGALVLQVFPNTTAQRAGIITNDIITAVNDVNIPNSATLVNFAKNLRGGESVTFRLKRNKNSMSLTSEVLPKPMEQSSAFNITYGDFRYKEGRVRTIFKSPKNMSPKATVYFLQGLPCYSLDNMQPLDKTKQAIDKMVELGFAVYIMEKGDLGDNENCPPCATMGFNEELAMYDAGYQNLLILKEVDKDKIFLFGHSMGGTTAPLLAAKYQPQGVIVYGTGFKPWSEYMNDAYLIQLSLRGADLGDLRENLEKYKPYLNEFFYTDKTAAQIASDPKGLLALREILGYNPMNQTGHSGRHISVFKELNQHNVARGFSNFNNYTLAIYGECDLNANNPLDNIALINHVNALRPGHGTFWLAPKSSHSFEEIGTMAEFIELWDNPQAYQQYAAQRFNPKIFDYAGAWMDSTLVKKSAVKVPEYYTDHSDPLPDGGAQKASMDLNASDIDGDGDLDIILANEFQPNSILINNGKGIFTDESTARLPQVVHDSEDVIVKDMDGDGDPNLIFCSEDDKIHEFYLNNGKGFFTPAPFQFPDSEANAVISADINKDGRPDVIFGNNGQNQIFINLGKGQFRLEPKRLPQISRVTQDLALVDLDNDGDLDLAEANEDGNILYLNNGKGFFTDVTSTHFISDPAIESRKISWSDIDKDGDIDLFFTNVNFRGNKNPQNRIYINNGKGKFSDETSSRIPTDKDLSIDAIFEDIDRDGDSDIIVANVFGGKIKVYLNDGKGYFTLGSDQLLGGKIVIDALGVIAADLDGDGAKDLYFCDRYNPQKNLKDVLLVRKR